MTTYSNPYRNRTEDFPGRLFPLLNREVELEEIGRIIALSREVFVELGSGSGMHLLELASEQPSRSVFGFERRYKRAVRTVEKASQRGIANAYVLRTDNSDVFRLFPEHSVDAMFVNFPDPWPKLRWHKHRTLSLELLNKLDILLKGDGFLSIKSDHREYFDSFLEVTDQQNSFVVIEQTKDLYNSKFIEGNIATEFENLFYGKGLPICYAKLSRRK